VESLGILPNQEVFFRVSLAVHTFFA